MGVSLLYHTNW